jgi:hypothetical protein
MLRPVIGANDGRRPGEDTARERGDEGGAGARAACYLRAAARFASAVAVENSWTVAT